MAVGAQVTDEKKTGRAVDKDGEELYWCDDCEVYFRAADAKPMHHSWSRHGDGEEFHPFECPECGETLYIPNGDPVRVEPDQKSLEKHLFHDVELHRDSPKQPIYVRCKGCGNDGNYVVTEEKIFKPKVES